MSKGRFLPLIFATVLATGALGGAALAKDQGDQSDAAALASAKVSLSQAITAAEQQVHGKAVSADVDNQNGVVNLAVEVATDQGVQTVLVDPQTGKVSAVQAGGDDEQEGEQAD